MVRGARANGLGVHVSDSSGMYGILWDRMDDGAMMLLWRCCGDGGGVGAVDAAPDLERHPCKGGEARGSQDHHEPCMNGWFRGSEESDPPRCQ